MKPFVKATAAIVMAATLIGSLSGCGRALVRVKVVNVWTSAQYEAANNWHALFPHVVLEDTETGERFIRQGETWGQVGDVFLIER
jgi:hypothetical protein